MLTGGLGDILGGDILGGDILGGDILGGATLGISLGAAFEGTDLDFRNSSGVINFVFSFICVGERVVIVI